MATILGGILTCVDSPRASKGGGVTESLRLIYVRASQQESTTSTWVRSLLLRGTVTIKGWSRGRGYMMFRAFVFPVSWRCERELVLE